MSRYVRRWGKREWSQREWPTPMGWRDEILFLDGRGLAIADTLAVVAETAERVYRKYVGTRDVGLPKRIVAFCLDDYGVTEENSQTYDTLYGLVRKLAELIDRDTLNDYALDNVALFEGKPASTLSLLDFDRWSLRSVLSSVRKREDLYDELKAAFKETGRAIDNKAPVFRTGREIAEELDEMEQECLIALRRSRLTAGKPRLG